MTESVPRPAELGAPSDGLPTVAAITMARDEGTMLRRWVDFYSAATGGAENVIVFDDGSTDGSTDGLACEVRSTPELVPGQRWGQMWMSLMSDTAEELLTRYDFVLFTDVDEFVVPDPAVHANLREFLSTRADRKIIGVTALNVVQDVRIEEPLDPTRPILEQRHYAKYLPLMCKPSLKQVPAAWVMGSHGIRAPYEVDPELFMLHMKFCDQQLLRDMGAKRLAVVQMDGRASATTWSLEPNELAEAMPGYVRNIAPGTAPEFDAHAIDLDEIVRRTRPHVYRATGMDQARAMRKLPLVRIPDRLAGAV